MSNYTCVCYDEKNSVCDKFVIFIKANYKNYIPDVSEVLSHVQAKRKYTKYICKQCHAILKSGKSPFDGDSNRCNDMFEYDKNCAEQNLSIHDYTCTCCHDVSNKRHLFIKFKQGKYNSDQHNVAESLLYQYVSAYNGEFIFRVCDQHLLANHMPPLSIRIPNKAYTHRINIMLVL